MRVYLLFIRLLCSIYAYAQTPITNAYFPAVGTTLINAKATNLTAFSIAVAPIGGSNLTWDFRSLRPQALDSGCSKKIWIFLPIKP